MGFQPKLTLDFYVAFHNQHWYHVMYIKTSVLPSVNLTSRLSMLGVLRPEHMNNEHSVLCNWMKSVGDTAFEHTPHLEAVFWASRLLLNLAAWTDRDTQPPEHCSQGNTHLLKYTAVNIKLIRIGKYLNYSSVRIQIQLFKYWISGSRSKWNRSEKLDIYQYLHKKFDKFKV